jgi:protein-L-isoaspartate O-methyltransferase
MKQWADRHPLPLNPSPSWTPPKELYPIPHSYYMDARHASMIRDELMTGKHRRVLEIGCYHGYSTCAFFGAVNHGKVDEVHLCDVQFREELHRAIAHYDVHGHVVLHERSSLELLAEDTAWDLVHVDGDHSEAVVLKEGELLRKAGIPVVFAHDTALGAVRYSITAPRKMANAFRGDGRYACLEDAQVRPGERTERGLFLAKLKQPQAAASARPSIVIATAGRDSIGKTLASITPQLLSGDEVIIERDNTGDVGATPRTRGMLAATGDYLFMDDDDVYTPNALAAVRKAIAEHRCLRQRH